MVHGHNLYTENNVTLKLAHIHMLENIYRWTRLTVQVHRVRRRYIGFWSALAMCVLRHVGHFSYCSTSLRLARRVRLLCQLLTLVVAGTQD